MAEATHIIVDRKLRHRVKKYTEMGTKHDTDSKGTGLMTPHNSIFYWLLK